MKGLSPFMSFLSLSAPVGYFWLYTKQFLSLQKSGKCSSLLYLELIGSKNGDFLGVLQNKNNSWQRGFGAILNGQNVTSQGFLVEFFFGFFLK